MRGERTNMQRTRKMDWNTDVSLVLQPLLMATDVLAIAAVEGTPPAKGTAMLAIP